MKWITDLVKKLFWHETAPASVSKVSCTTNGMTEEETDSAREQFYYRWASKQNDINNKYVSVELGDQTIHGYIRHFDQKRINVGGLWIEYGEIKSISF